MILRAVPFLLLAALAALAPSRAPAAEMEFGYRDPNRPAEGTLQVLIRGDLVEGDAAQLRALIRDATSAGRRVQSVSLRSPGGSLLEGLRLAAEVRSRKLVAVVPRDSMCASACFLVFAAGQGKIVQPGARVGVHGVSVDGIETDAAARGTIVMAREATRLGVPPAIVGRMAVTPPSEMVWLSRDELASMAGKFGHVMQP